MVPRFAALLVLATAGCLTPPAVFEVGEDFDAALRTYPPGTEKVVLDLPDGPRLAGVFVPAGPEAPVMLHLQEAGASVGLPEARYGLLFARLRDLGVASLCLDWSGVGLSTGRRSPRHLRRDARAMWAEAVRRAGAPGRVVVRGISLGALTAAHLVEDGVQPAAWLLVVPVLADSAAERFAAAFHGPFFAWVASWLYRDLTDVDLLEALGRVTAPLVVVSSEGDIFLDDDEIAVLREITRASGGRYRDEPGGHFLTAVRARELFPEEIDLLAAAFDGVLGKPDELAVRLARLEGVSPEVASAVAAEVGPAREGIGAAVLEAWRFASYGASEWPPEVLEHYLDHDDPAGPLPHGIIQDLRRRRDEYVDLDMVYVTFPGNVLASLVPTLLGGGGLSWNVFLDAAGRRLAAARWSPEPLVAAVASLPGPDAERQLLRSLLKVFRLPDRIVKKDDGWTVQAFENGAWHDVVYGGPSSSQDVFVHLPTVR